VCPRCHAARRPDARFCVRCGDVLDALDAADDAASGTPDRVPDGRRRPCRSCDLEAPETDPYCSRCGALGPARGAAAPGATRGEGWYADPFGRARTRWWDGSTWSAYVADGSVHWDPVSFAPERQPGVRGMGIAIAGFTFGVLVGFPASFAMHEAGEPGGRAVLLLVSALTLWAGLGGALLYVTYVRGSRSLVTDFGLRFRWVDIPLGIAGWIAGRILGGIMIVPIIAAWPDLRPTDDDVYGEGSISTATWIVLALVVCVGAPFIEELFFRGLVQTRLVGRYGAFIGIGVTSVLFGAAHLIGWVGPVTFVFATAITGAGIVLGLLRHLTGRLGPAILAHVFFNTQALLMVWLLR